MSERLLARLDKSGCLYCPATIAWVYTVAGKRMPLDVEPHPKGNVVLLDDPKGPIARTLNHPELVRSDPPVPRYRSHFATCSGADKARRHQRAHRRRDIEERGLL